MAKSHQMELNLRKKAETSKIRPLLAGWFGGKSKLAGAIIERIPDHNCYAEPFAGAAWVLFRKGPSKVEVLNDISRDIVNLYRFVQASPEDFFRRIEYALYSRAVFNDYINTDPASLDDEERAIRFYYILQHTFGGKVDSKSFASSKVRLRGINLEALPMRLKAIHKRLARVCIECLTYAELIRRYDGPRTFFYVDPPYWDYEKAYGRGIFSKADFSVLAQLLGGIKGKFLLSMNDRPEVRRIFAEFNLEPVQTRYTVSNQFQMQARELFITNY